jgi:hypothetical protein
VTDQNVDDARRLAAEIGLENPAPEVLEQLPLAAATAAKHRAALKAYSLSLADEPAVVFSVEEARER